MKSKAIFILFMAHCLSAVVFFILIISSAVHVSFSDIIFFLCVGASWSAAFTAGITLAVHVILWLKHKAVPVSEGKWAYKLLVCTTAPLTVTWILLTITSISEGINAFELIVAAFLYLFVSVLFIFFIKTDKKIQPKIQIILLAITFLLFVIPRENGNINWNFTTAQDHTSTNSFSTQSSSTMNADGISTIPGAYGASADIAIVSINGPFSDILKEKLLEVKSDQENSVYITINGTIQKPALSLVLPFVKYGNIRANITVSTNYQNGTVSFDSDLDESWHLNRTSTITITYESRRYLFGVSSIHEFKKQAAEAIAAAVIDEIKKDLGYD